MDELLISARISEPSLQSRASASEVSSYKTSSYEIDSPQEVLEALRNKPDLSSLRAVIKYLEGTQDGRFNIKIPSAMTTQILNLLVNDVLPTYWPQLTEDRSLKALQASILDVLRNIPAVGAIHTRLRALIKPIELPTEPGVGKMSSSNVSALLDILQMVLIPDDFVTRIWKAIQSLSSKDSYKLSLWRDFISRLSNGVLVSVAAEAESVLVRSNDITHGSSWVASGNDFARWTARNISHLLLSAALTSPDAKSASEYLGKTLSLGYTGACTGMD
jgi:telomere length regulation protein